MRRAACSIAAARLIAALPAAAERAPARQLLGQPPHGRARSRRTASTCATSLDQAEIPTFQERGAARRRELLARKRAAVARGVTLTVDGPPVPLRARAGRRSALPAGQGGLRTTRVELTLRAAAPRRAPSSCATRRSPAASAGARSSCARARDRRALDASPPTIRRAGCASIPQALLTRPADVRERAPARRARATARLARRPGVRGPDRRTRAAGDGLAGASTTRPPGAGVLRPAAARRVRLGRGARAVARPRQGDGRGLPGRHARRPRGTRSPSARPSPSPTRSASSRSGW